MILRHVVERRLGTTLFDLGVDGAEYLQPDVEAANRCLMFCTEAQASARASSAVPATPRSMARFQPR